MDAAMPDTDTVAVTRASRHSASNVFFGTNELVTFVYASLPPEDHTSLTLVNKDVWRAVSAHRYAQVDSKTGWRLHDWVPKGSNASFYRKLVRTVKLSSAETCDIERALLAKRVYPGMLQLEHTSRDRSTSDTIIFSSNSNGRSEWRHNGTVTSLYGVESLRSGDHILVDILERYTFQDDGLRVSDAELYDAAMYHPKIADFAFSRTPVDLELWSSTYEARIHSGVSPAKLLHFGSQEIFTVQSILFLLQTVGETLESLSVKLKNGISPRQGCISLPDIATIAQAVRRHCPKLRALHLGLNLTVPNVLDGIHMDCASMLPLGSGSVAWLKLSAGFAWDDHRRTVMAAAPVYELAHCLAFMSRSNAKVEVSLKRCNLSAGPEIEKMVGYLCAQPPDFISHIARLPPYERSNIKFRSDLDRMLTQYQRPTISRPRLTAAMEKLKAWCAADDAQGLAISAAETAATEDERNVRLGIVARNMSGTTRSARQELETAMRELLESIV